MQLAERRAIELGEPFLLDGVEAAEPVLRAILELDVDHEGFEQVVLEQKEAGYDFLALTAKAQALLSDYLTCAEAFLSEARPDYQALPGPTKRR